MPLTGIQVKNAGAGLQAHEGLQARNTENSGKSQKQTGASPEVRAILQGCFLWQQVVAAEMLA